MLNGKDLIKVRNSSNSTVGYNIPDLGNFHRLFSVGETKEIEFSELEKLACVPGGRALLEEYLTIENKEALGRVLGKVEPEYFYTNDDVKNILLNGSIEQFMDFLDFAPEGKISLIKDLAVSLEVNDVKKREAIYKKTGFNVNSAIKINKEVEEAAGKAEETQVTRRAAPINHDESPKPTPTVRRYNVISEG